MIPTEALRNRQINHSVLPKVSSEKAGELCRHRLEPGDILFARRGVQATGHIGYVREREDGFLCGTGAIRLRVINERQPHPILPEFLSHVFANPASVAWFKIHAIGATMPNLNEGIIRDFPLRLPPTAEQHRIAGVLSALDDKIDLNRRMNQTLEAIARAVFKSWFMNFDPVCNQTERGHLGRHETTENVGRLFPSSFQASELGLIPVGWHVESLDGVCEFAYGRTLPEDMRHKGSFPVYGSNGQVGWHDEALVKGPGIVIGRKGNPGTVVWVEDDFYPIDTTFYVVSKVDYGLTYLRYALATLNLPSLAADSAVPGLNRSMAYRSKLVVPPPELLKQFHRFVDPFLKLIKRNASESETIALFRELLQPRLLSGELRIQHAGRMVETRA